MSELAYAWCCTCEVMVARAEWWKHDVHPMLEAHPKGARRAAPLGMGGDGGGPKKPPTRWTSGLPGWDRCTGGGIVPSTRILLTGDPGCGKSTLSLLVLWMLAQRGLRVLYLTAEETREEIEMRFRGMGLRPSRNLNVYATESWEAASAAITHFRPQVTVIDSLHEFRVSGVNADTGDPRHVSVILRATKGMVERHSMSFILIGHINKAGEAYGRMKDVHAVTAWLHFAKLKSGLRILRSEKNRHGPGEMAVYEFPPDGKLIREHVDVSSLLLTDLLGREGVCAYPALATEQIARAVAVPVEAAVSLPKGQSEPRVRNAQGLPDRMLDDAMDRLSDVGVKFTDRSVRVQAPVLGDALVADESAMLALCVAMVSSVERHALGAVGAFGTLGASGRLAPDPQTDRRLATLREAGVTLAFGPTLRDMRPPPGIEYGAVEDLADLVAHVQSRAALARVREAAADTQRRIEAVEKNEAAPE